MDLGLEGKVAVVTGASRGIGLAIAEGFAAEGCRLAICARGQDGLKKAAEALEQDGAEVLALPLDITEPDAGDRLIQAAMERFGGVHVLVNNAGGNRRGRVAELGEEDWEALLELNFRSHIRTSRAAMSVMAEGSSILFVASIYGREAGGPGLSAYNSTKSALISLSKILALELAPKGIRVNSIAPRIDPIPRWQLGPPVFGGSRRHGRVCGPKPTPGSIRQGRRSGGRRGLPELGPRERDHRYVLERGRWSEPVVDLSRFGTASS